MNAPLDFAGFDFASLANLHFLRPWWLLGLLALPLLAVAWRFRQRRRNAWHGIVDAHLLPTLLDTTLSRRGRVGLWIAMLAGAIAVLAMAGPSWRQSAQPLWQSRTPLVIALDLSSASLAADLPPSRLAQARAKLATLLRERNGGQVALVAFADDAYTVAPLTDDAANVALFLDALQPDVMPVDGQRADRAIAWSMQLLKRAGASQGDILLMTDHADNAARDAASDAAGAGYRVSVTGLGGDAGVAYRRTDGQIANARLDRDSLRRLASAGNGRYADITGDVGDLRSLGLLDPGSASGSALRGQAGLTWQDEGYWLLPPLLLLALFAFRRGAGTLAVLALCFIFPLQSAHAADLWRRADQAEHARMQRGDAAYRKGDFAGAAKQYEGIDNADANYNRGNALAKAGQLQPAIDAFDRALRQRPKMDDALANRRAVEQALKRQQQGGSNQSQRGGKTQSGQGGQSQQQGGQQQRQDPSTQSSQQRSQQQNQQQQNQQQAGKGAQQNQDRLGQSSQPQTGQTQQDPANRQSQAASQQSTAPAKPTDAATQQQADRAQREKMQRELQAQQARAEKNGRAATAPKETAEQRERRIANDAWLRRVPDDPGGLLRAKFRLEFERRQQQGRPGE
ncbi:VWA domain-containing protein [Lysobacter fragariae]